jgi:uncharacterized iron-regulated membrane protein
MAVATRTGFTVTSRPANSPVVKTRVVRWLFWLHRWTGLIAAVPMAVILISGTVAVFKDEIDELLNPALLVVEPHGTPISLDRAFDAVRSEARPVLSVYLPEHDRRPYLFYRRGPGGRAEQVAIDPYHGIVLGSRPANGHFADILRQLHVRFYFFGATGRIVVGAFGLVLAVSGISGLILYPRFLRAQKWHEIRWARGPQWIHSDLHKLFGIGTLALNLLWAITGAVLGLENLTAYYRPAQEYIHPYPSVQASSNRLGVPLENALAAARQSLPGFIPNNLAFPAGERGPLIVYGNSGGRWTAPASSWVALDASTGLSCRFMTSGRPTP